MIKVIEGLAEWEVMKAASEGKRVVYKYLKAGEWLEAAKFIDKYGWNWEHHIFAIIDESQPKINWNEEEWNMDLFNQYGGLRVFSNEGEKAYTYGGWIAGDNFTLRESPFYSWFGGKQPVPDNVEVVGRVIILDTESNKFLRIAETTNAAEAFGWEFERLIAFRLTGRVL